jgi:hypothetical protein
MRVKGIDALAAELDTRGAAILDGPTDRVYGQRELVIRDCNGLILAFGEETASGDGVAAEQLNRSDSRSSRRGRADMAARPQVTADLPA